MAEVYPSDNTLLNLQADGETGVEYIPTGTAPYYLHFRKLLYRLLLAARRANDLRVYDEGGLDVGVKAGAFWLGTSQVSYAGSSGNTLADDKAGIYLYLDAQGNLVTNEYAGFPSMATTPQVRLAIVTTAGGDITSITDCRGGRDADDYDLALTDKGGGRYVGNFDSDIPAGRYAIQVFRCAGANPADGDPLVASRDILWTTGGELTTDKLLANKAEQDKATGAVTYYDDDGETVLLTHTPSDDASSITRAPSYEL